MIEMLEVDDGAMPEGHDWAVVRLPERVMILVRESVVDRARMNPALVNEALRRAC